VFLTSWVFVLVVSFMFVVGYNPQQKIKHKIENMKIMLLMLRFFIFISVCFSGWFCVCCRLQSSSTQNTISKAWKSCFYCCVFYFGCVCFSDWFCICYEVQPSTTQNLRLYFCCNVMFFNPSDSLTIKNNHNNKNKHTQRI